MEQPLRRIARRLLAKTPRMYRAALRLLRRGSVEKHLYLAIVQKGDVVMDIGANVGYFTMLFSDLTGDRGEVHAFEPVPSTFSLLAENIHRFPVYKNVYLNRVALGDKIQTTTMLLPRGDHGQASLVRHSDGSWKDGEHKIASIEIEMTRLDQYAQPLGRIDFVKCDVEGAELLVLRGAQSTLRRCRPKIFLEIDERWVHSFGWTKTDVLRYLREIGYSCFYGVDSRLTPLSEDTLRTGAVLCSWEELCGLAQRDF
jgi:FkbM family methyltransferase